MNGISVRRVWDGQETQNGPNWFLSSEQVEEIAEAIVALEGYEITFQLSLHWLTMDAEALTDCPKCGEELSHAGLMRWCSRCRSGAASTEDERTLMAAVPIPTVVPEGVEVEIW